MKPHENESFSSVLQRVDQKSYARTDSIALVLQQDHARLIGI